MEGKGKRETGRSGDDQRGRMEKSRRGRDGRGGGKYIPTYIAASTSIHSGENHCVTVVHFVELSRGTASNDGSRDGAGE